ncbi:MAG: 50S ribosomal protein L10 [Candidatus Omnitrophota bacterium]
MAKQEKYARLCKEKMVDEIVSRIAEHPDFVITSYMGSSTADLESLRKSLKKSASSYLVVKNSILKIVFDRIKLTDEVAKIDGGMGLSFGGKDILSTCKALSAFAKACDKFKIKGAIVDGMSITPDKVNMLASLPSKEVLLSRVFAGMKNPVTGFVNVLSGVIRKFVCVVDAVKISKLGADLPGPAAEDVKA